MCCWPHSLYGNRMNIRPLHTSQHALSALVCARQSPALINFCPLSKDSHCFMHRDCSHTVLHPDRGCLVYREASRLQAEGTVSGECNMHTAADADTTEISSPLIADFSEMEMAPECGYSGHL